MPGYFHCSGLILKIRKSSCIVNLFPLVLLFFFHVSNAQRLKIDSLKSALQYLSNDSAIDCLNTLSLAYTYLNKDSAELYSEKAYAESSKKNYREGMAMSLNNKAHIAGMILRNFSLQEKISQQTIHAYKNLSDKKVLEEAYMNLALALFCQSYFNLSVDACDKIIQLSEKSGNKKELGESIALMGSISFETGNYEKSFEYFKQSLLVFTSIHDDYNTAILLAKIGDLYYLAGDSTEALNFYYKSLQYPTGPSLDWHPLIDLGDTYYSLEKYDSLNSDEKYMQAIKTLTIKSNYVSFPKIIIAEKYIASKEYNKALSLLLQELELTKENKDRNEMMRLLDDITEVYEGKKDYNKAFYYTKYLLQNAQNYKLRQYVRDAYKLLYLLYDHAHNVDSAYNYYRQYTDMKDSVAVDEFTKKLAIYKAVTENEKKQSQITLLSEEKLINQQQLQLSRQQLKNESFFKNILLTGVLILILLGFIILRNITLKRKNESHRHEIIEKELTLQKLESERSKSEIQQKASELEMRALRAQMNPHFIFNCLNSINRFIIANNSAEAANHLTKFAKLIRIVLEQSGKPFISLEDELYCLQLYMDLETLRFEIPFHYQIKSDGIDISSVMIPSLLLQPFVENAIWHGLNGSKNKNGMVNINMRMENSILHCKIIDNGIGRAKANAYKPIAENRKKSLGIGLTQNRLQLIDSSKGVDLGIIIYDLTDESGENAGTCVEIKIPVKEM